MPYFRPCHFNNNVLLYREAEIDDENEEKFDDNELAENVGRVYFYFKKLIQNRKQGTRNTRDSQGIPGPSTNRILRCLTCQIGWDGVCSAWFDP